MRCSQHSGERNWDGVLADHDYHFSVRALQGRKRNPRQLLRALDFKTKLVGKSTRCTPKSEHHRAGFAHGSAHAQDCWVDQGAGFPVSFVYCAVTSLTAFSNRENISSISSSVMIRGGENAQPSHPGSARQIIL